MTSTKKLLIVLCSPLVVSAILVCIGLASHRTEYMGVAGFLLLFLCFNAFAFADRFLKRMRAIRGSKSFNRYASVLDGQTRYLVETLANLPIESAIMIRGFFLSLSFWIVDLFVALCSGGIWAFFEQVNKNLIMTVLTLGVATLETSRGKSISRPGFLTRLMSTLGAFQFFRGLYLLGAGVLGREIFRAMEYFLSHPLWFLFAEQRYRVADVIISVGSLWILFFFGLCHLFIFFPSLKVLFEQRTEDNTDAKHFALAMVLICCWMFTLPIFEIGAFIYFLSTHST